MLHRLLKIRRNCLRNLLDRRLNLLGHCGHRQWTLIVRQPRRDVRAIASEIEERAVAVLRRIGKSGKEFWLYADFLGTLVSIADHGLANLTA